MCRDIPLRSSEALGGLALFPKGGMRTWASLSPQTKQSGCLGSNSHFSKTSGAGIQTDERSEGQRELPCLPPLCPIKKQEEEETEHICSPDSI